MRDLGKKYIRIGIILLTIFIEFTALVRIVDVKAVGVGASDLGFATINTDVFGFLGASSLWHTVTDVLGFVALAVAAAFALLGLCQLIKRRSLKRVDSPILMLGALYIAVIIFYVFFEIVVINYAPIVIDGEPAASYPSSHTLLVVTVMTSAITVFNSYVKKRAYRIAAAAFSFSVIGLTVVGRLLAGVHWLTDIFASLILSSALIVLFFGGLELTSPKSEADEEH